MGVLEAIALLAAGGWAGAVNAVAGGGSLISFPALLAVGYSPVAANVTNQVGLVAGYLGGSLGYRAELTGQRARARALSVTAGVGAAAGAALLLLAPAHSFKVIVPYLVLASCALLALQRQLTRAAGRPRTAHPGVPLHAGVFVASVYGGYFGGALGIVLLAILGALLADGLQRLNALQGTAQPRRRRRGRAQLRGLRARPLGRGGAQRGWGARRRPHGGRARATAATGRPSLGGRQLRDDSSDRPARVSERDGRLRIDGSREKRGLASSTWMRAGVRQLGSVTTSVIATEITIAASSYQ